MAKPREIVVALFLSFVSGTILGLAVTHASDRLGDIPIEVRPHVGAALAAATQITGARDRTAACRWATYRPSKRASGCTCNRSAHRCCASGAKVIFTGRSAIAHDSARGAGCNIAWVSSGGEAQLVVDVSMRKDNQHHQRRNQHTPRNRNTKYPSIACHRGHAQLT
jgi:hypothetical protein